MNPALDKSLKVNSLVPNHKLECHSIQYHPGGGGINISRVLNRLEVNHSCIFPFGGDSGAHLVRLLEKENIKPTALAVKSWTRENLSLTNVQNGFQYRLGMPGNRLSDKETATLEALLYSQISENDIVVISGSLPEGLPLDYYAKLIQNLSTKKVKIIIDTPGPVLKEAIKNQVFLIKPNQLELAQLAGKEFLSSADQETFAMELVSSNKVTYVVVSLGARGAFIASKDGISYIYTPSVLVKSTIGAGDSMVAGLIYAILNGDISETILKWGVACGVAATLSEGTQLAQRDNIGKVLKMLD